MVVAPEEYNALIARVFDGALVIDGVRVIAHKSGMHVVRDRERKQDVVVMRPIDRDNDWSYV